MKECIIVIDPQRDFTSKESLYAKRHSGIDQILHAKERINRLISLQENRTVAIIISNYQKDQFEQGLSICIPGTAGHIIDLEITNTCTIMVKTQHSCFSSAAFSRFLEFNGIQKLMLCGFLAEYCVKSTALDALQEGYQVALIDDCIGTGDDVQHRKTEMLLTLKEMGATVLDSSLIFEPAEIKKPGI